MAGSTSENAKSRQYSLRLPLGVSDAVQAFARQHEISINRAVVDLLERGLNAPAIADELHHEPSALERLATLEDMVRAHEGAIVALMEQHLAPRQTPVNGQDAIPGDPGAYLGRLCPQGHDWQNTGRSRRSRRNHSCMQCEAAAAQARRARARAKGKAAG